MEAVLGVDAGGTKTEALICDRQGRVLGLGRSGCGNYQACGVAGAAGQLERAVAAAAEQAGLAAAALSAACYGVAGADRPKDFAVIDGLVRPLACGRYRLVNDTLVALRAGTEDGVGLALIAGTGANAIGRTADGRTHQVGGLGRLTGDYGAASQLAEAAVLAAFMATDGRGPHTTLVEKLCRQLDLERLEDIVEFEFYDMPRPPLQMGLLAPLVFEAAAEGDEVARRVLVEAGREASRAAVAVLDRLFPDPDAAPTVVFGGSVFMHGASPELIDTVKDGVLAVRPRARFVRLDVAPVIGAVEFAFDEMGWGRDPARCEQLRQGYRDQAAADES